ncbi:hypothetical protein PSH08_15910 [Enterococcus gallinarum]|uniref:hypothetical protein n=1 Tax=Enterococcus gallinarum TaxID=1353 RepID=UPI002953F10D|nr:hypothetical protein [Enterococcus gallinarum]MDV7824460.1 hypothetical protein [Enterococcus gallinarum]
MIGNPSLNHRYRKGFYSLFKTLQQNPIWYNPNIECQNGYAYGPTNLKNGKCRVNWNGVINDTIGNMTSATNNIRNDMRTILIWHNLKSI